MLSLVTRWFGQGSHVGGTLFVLLGAIGGCPAIFPPFTVRALEAPASCRWVLVPLPRRETCARSPERGAVYPNGFRQTPHCHAGTRLGGGLRLGSAIRVRSTSILLAISIPITLEEPDSQVQGHLHCLNTPWPAAFFPARGVRQGTTH